MSLCLHCILLKRDFTGLCPTYSSVGCLATLHHRCGDPSPSLGVLRQGVSLERNILKGSSLKNYFLWKLGIL